MLAFHHDPEAMAYLGNSASATGFGCDLPLFASEETTPLSLVYHLPVQLLRVSAPS